MLSSLSDDESMLLDSVHTKFKRKRKAGHDKLEENKFGEYIKFFSGLKRDKARFFEYTKMTQETLNYILKEIEHFLVKTWLNWHWQLIQPIGMVFI